MEGVRPVSRWLLTPCKSVLLHRRRERASGSDVLGRAGVVRRRSGCGLGWGWGSFWLPIYRSAGQARIEERYFHVSRGI